MESKITVKSIEADRIGEGAATANVIFNVSVVLEEALRVPEKLKVQFNIEMESDPKIGSITATGDALFTGEDKKIDELLEVSAKRDELPKVFMEIYKRLYPVFYLLANSVDLPYPALMRERRPQGVRQGGWRPPRYRLLGPGRAVLVPWDGLGQVGPG